MRDECETVAKDGPSCQTCGTYLRCITQQTRILRFVATEQEHEKAAGWTAECRVNLQSKKEP